jgi:glycogen(starch) synthase
MARADPEIEWLFVGDGPLRAELERAAAGLRIRFAGLLDAEGVAQAFAAADACAVFSETEALGLAAVEAILSGTPVVALPTGGLAEIVEDGVTGILVRDVGRLAEEIRRAVAMRVPEEAVERLARRFDERAVARRIARLYSEAAEAQRCVDHVLRKRG